MMRSFLPFKEIHVSQAQFAFNLLCEIELNKSVVISPLSISITLGMALLGAKNKTAEEIQNAIAKDIVIDEIHSHFSRILEFVKQNSAVIKMAEKVYCVNKLTILDEYESGIQEFYDGNFEVIDFLNDHDVDKINKFVAASTNYKINDIVETKMYNECTAMLLINVLIFEGKWENSFELLQEKQPFYTSENSSIEVTMMKRDVVFCGYISFPKCEMVEIPYQDKIFSTYVILPKKGFNLLEVLKDIDVRKMLTSMKRKLDIKGKIIIPKFKIDSSFDLKEMLQKLNINDAFDAEKADFSGIGSVAGVPLYASSESGNRCRLFLLFILYINNKIAKKTPVFQVDENGTTAAGATVFVTLYKSTGPQRYFEFIADHPFIFLIVDKSLNIYFVGTFCGDN